MPSAGTIEARLTLNAQQFVKAMESARKQVINLADEALASSRQQSIAINKLVTSYSGVSVSLRNIKTAQDAMRSDLDKNLEKIKEYGASSHEVTKLSKAFSFLELDVQELTQRMKELTAAGKAEIEESRRLAASIPGLAAALKKEQVELEKAASYVQRYEKFLASLGRTEKTLTATEQARRASLQADVEKARVAKDATENLLKTTQREIPLAQRAAQAHLRSAQALGSEITAIQRSEKATLKKVAATAHEAEKTHQATQASKAKEAQEKRTAAATEATSRSSMRATHSFGTFSKAIGTSITLWYTFRTAIFAVRRAVESVIEIYKRGTEATDDFRLAVISASAIMSGSIVEGTTAAEKMGMALAYNTEMYKKLEVVAARHISTGKAVRDVYEGLIIARLFPGKADVENVAKLADYITLYTKGQRLEVQLMQEVRGLMDGQVRAQNKLAYTLDRLLNGKLKEHIQLWRNAGKDASGQLVILKEITRLLGDIGSLQGEILGTAQTWENTLTTIAERLLRDSIIGYYRDYRDLVKAISEYLFDLTEEYYTQEGILVKGIIQEGWLRLKDVARGFVGGELTDMREIVTDIFRRMYYWLREDTEGFKQLGRSARAAFDGIYAVLVNIKIILKSILAIALPAWIIKIGIALGQALFVVESIGALILGWIPVIVGLTYAFWEATGNASDLELALDSMGEATYFGAEGAERMADAAAKGAKEVLNLEKQAREQSERFLTLLERQRQKQVSVNDVYGNFADEVERVLELPRTRPLDLDAVKQRLEIEERITELGMQTTLDLKEKLGLLAGEKILLRDINELESQRAKKVPTFFQETQIDEKFHEKAMAFFDRIANEGSKIAESTLKLEADWLKDSLEAQGRKVEGAKLAMRLELEAFKENRGRMLQSLKNWINKNVKNETDRLRMLERLEAGFTQVYERELAAKTKALQANVDKIAAQEVESKQRAVEAFDQWRIKDELSAQGRINKLRAELNIRGEQQIIDQVAQLRLTLAKKIEDINTQTNSRIAEATKRAIAQYGSEEAALKAITEERRRINAEAREEKELAEAITAEQIEQVNLLKQMAHERQMASIRAAHAQTMKGIETDIEQIKWGQTPAGPRLALQAQQEKDIQSVIDKYDQLITKQEEFANSSAEAWSRASEQISAYNIDMLAELDSLRAKHKAQMDKTRTLEAEGWLAAAEFGVSNIAEMFRLMAEHNKKYFKWYQVFAVGQILISTAMAIMKVWETFAAVPPLAAALTATIAGLSAAQIGVVLAQKPPSEMAEGGAGQLGLKGMYGVYNRPTYMVAEAGASEAVVPLDKYDISRKGAAGQTEVHNHYYINALDPAAWADFARRNPGPFREQFVRSIEDNDPAVRGAIRAAR